MRITIHTATYNRAYILGRAYESLCAQSCKDFEWIITDDGSADETEQLVHSWQARDNGFDIIYNKIEHGGIPRALNSGIKKANTEWFMILDSDDKILPNTVEKVMGWLDTIKNRKDFVGVGFARCFPNGRFMKNQTPVIDHQIGYVDASNIERKKYHLDMDMCEVSRISLLKRFPFKCWPSEMFAPEQLNYNEIALAGYKYRWYDEKLYICDYLPDGLTKDNQLVKKNPMGFAMMYNQNIKLSESFFEKCRCAMQMTALSLYSGHPGYLLQTEDLAATLVSFPLGILLSIRRRWQFR